MKLIKKLEIRKGRSGKTATWGLFGCPKCGKTVERTVSDGNQNKTCSHRCQNLKHGDNDKGKRARLWRIWRNMKTRCYNVNIRQYKNYGGRGISVCHEWHEYIPFRTWALANGYADNLTIDRIENNGNYCPDNCQFITRSENSKKARSFI